MAMALAEVLEEHGTIDRHKLALAFARNFARDPGRGYGIGAMRLLAEIGMGKSWEVLSPAAFRGQGSMGNGSAMRVAPVGAYFADDLDQVVEQADRSAQVTHWHPEGRAGAIAVAVASALAWQMRADDPKLRPGQFFDAILIVTPSGPTQEGIAAACDLGPDASVSEAVRLLGNGSHIMVPDTVPFCLWCAAWHLDNYVDAIWTTIEGLGDVDTTCAIVGGIVSLSAGEGSVPEEWLRNRELLEL